MVVCGCVALRQQLSPQLDVTWKIFGDLITVFGHITQH